MSSSTKIFDANRVTVLFGVIPIESGLADGEFFKIEYTTDAFETKTGTDGEVTRSKTNQTGGKGMIRVMKTSSSNAALAALHNADKTLPNGAGIVPLAVTDNNSNGTIIVATSVWITKMPSISIDRGATVHEWPFECQGLVINLGSY